MIGKKVRCTKCNGPMVLKPVDGDADPEGNADEGDSSITDEIRSLKPIASRRISEASKKMPTIPKEEKKKKKPAAPRKKTDRRVLMISLITAISIIVVVAILGAAVIMLPHLFDNTGAADSEAAVEQAE